MASTLSTAISGLGASIQQNAFTLLVPTFDCALAENDGAKRGQPVTTAGKCARPETAQSKPIRNPRQPTATAQDRMVRRGRRFESVRALQKRRTWIKARRGDAPDRPTNPHPNMRAGGTLAFYATRINSTEIQATFARLGFVQRFVLLLFAGSEEVCGSATRVSPNT
jgi:hypothetical protein